MRIHGIGHEIIHEFWRYCELFRAGTSPHARSSASRSACKSWEAGGRKPSPGFLPHQIEKKALLTRIAEVLDRVLSTRVGIVG